MRRTLSTLDHRQEGNGNLRTLRELLLGQRSPVAKLPDPTADGGDDVTQGAFSLYPRFFGRYQFFDLSYSLERGNPRDCQ